MRIPARITRRALLAGALVSSAVLGACYHRQYDENYGYGGPGGYDGYNRRDGNGGYYGTWSEQQEPYYRRWEHDTKREHRSWEERNEHERQSYWQWRRDHRDRDYNGDGDRR